MEGSQQIYVQTKFNKNEMWFTMLTGHGGHPDEFSSQILICFLRERSGFSQATLEMFICVCLDSDM